MNTSTLIIDTPASTDESVAISSVDLNVDGLLELVDYLSSVDTSSPLAKLNETTISDNNGGRIEL